MQNLLQGSAPDELRELKDRCHCQASLIAELTEIRTAAVGEANKLQDQANTPAAAA